MKKIRTNVVNLILISSSLSLLPIYATANPPPVPTASAAAQTNSLAPMLTSVMPAVVNIDAKGRVPLPSNPFIPQPLQPKSGPRFESNGSGVIVDAKNGYIVTNAHVVADTKYITVTLNDGRHYQAKVIGADDSSDIAIIQIQAPNLTAIPFGNSNQLKVGDYVVAIGSPFDLKQSVTSGIVSGLGRDDLGIEGYEDFIQTDAPINPGNSGGALVNLQGQLIGVNTAILSANGASIGIGFAIPSDMVKSVMSQLIQFGNVKRGVLGVVVQDLTPLLASSFNVPIQTQGALVATVLPGSPAAKAGFKPGDVITNANNNAVTGAASLRNAIGLTRVGGNIALSVIRQGKPITLTVVSADPNSIEQATTPQNALFEGVTLENYSAMTSDQSLLQGVQITEIGDTTPAWTAGLRPGDVITTLNGRAVSNVNSFAKLLAQSTSNILMTVNRRDNSIFVVIPLDIAKPTTNAATPSSTTKTP